MPYLLPIHSDRPVDNKLSRLPGTTRKQSPENSRIQPPLQRRERHLRKRRKLLRRSSLLFTITFAQSVHLPSTLQSRATTSGNLRPVVLGQPSSVHGDDAADAAGEHALPLRFGDLFTVVCASGGFSGPLLLEEGSVAGAWVAEAL